MEAAMNHINRAFKTGTDSFFWIHKRTDGTTFPADVLLTRMPLKDRNVLQATVRDLTKQKEAEEKLRQNSDRIEMMNEKLRVVGGLSRHDVKRARLSSFKRNDVDSTRQKGVLSFHEWLCFGLRRISRIQST
jgi:PAS domain-containing protein